jgi:hypothetical protein
MERLRRLLLFNREGLGLPRGEMHLAGSKERWLVYTEPCWGILMENPDK